MGCPMCDTDLPADGLLTAVESCPRCQGLWFSEGSVTPWGVMDPGRTPSRAWSREGADSGYTTDWTLVGVGGGR